MIVDRVEEKKKAYTTWLSTGRSEDKKGVILIEGLKIK